MRGLFIGLLLVIAATASGATTNGLIAFFPLRGDGGDATGRNPPMQLTNAPFVKGALYLRGIYEPISIGKGYYQAGDMRGYHATASIPGLDYESLTISLDFHPLRAKPVRPLRGFEPMLNYLSRGYY